MARVLVPLADGVEEIEAVTIIDVLRRAGVEVICAGLSENPITASRRVRLIPDKSLEAFRDEDFDMVVLPGGGDGVENLKRDPRVEAILQSQSLGMARIGNVIRVAPLERLRREREDDLASKRATEKLGDLRTGMIHLKYANARDMIPVVKQFLSERGTVSADERTNTLIIRDISKNIEEIRDLFR